ncbi:gamma-glutamyl-gamma-aminobutyrate hydrolase family protein [Anaerolineales bacterium HSG24]|nr:gamma-glutamyl-gamma-aminobutyrate hydrolase family protein [Anaerolineales bacterium HSG24]
MTQSYPIIGVPCRSDISNVYKGRLLTAQNTSYLDAIITAGAVPMLIPLKLQNDQLEAIFRRVDGLVFTGGGDIDPTHYNETVQVDNLGKIQPDRDRVEIALMQMAINKQKPFFGICRGMQIMNVAIGGTLWQDISLQKPDALRHDYFRQSNLHYERDYLAHTVTFADDSWIATSLQTNTIGVNSLHHQGIRILAPNLQAVAHSEDGLIEAVEIADHPFALGVQWHPEELVDSQEFARELFTAFVREVRSIISSD